MNFPLLFIFIVPHLALATCTCTGTIEVLGGNGRLKICGNDIQTVFQNAGIQLIRTPQDGSGCGKEQERRESLGCQRPRLRLVSFLWDKVLSLKRASRLLKWGYERPPEISLQTHVRNHQPRDGEAAPLLHIIGQGGGVVCYGPWLVTSRARAHLPTYSGPLTAQNTHKVYGEAPRTGSIVLVHDFPSRMSSSLGIERFIHGPESTFDNELERLAQRRSNVIVPPSPPVLPHGAGRGAWSWFLYREYHGLGSTYAHALGIMRVCALVPTAALETEHQPTAVPPLVSFGNRRVYRFMRECGEMLMLKQARAVADFGQPPRSQSIPPKK
ncbi:hypothetical protein AG1IA_07920 [Rhizoctonia solani AG-1 IA]|uniref:Uncharacterized protein n=1 Tax=Thanatephorus cucumeris (strain AG1-IA) TaxID=983506 RepID=L8WMN2_THACA|nr:hypothetical protein AG1IA_07920 [Rhizoctonia solani AG-1 IA]